jgi:hypothetical protein
MPHRSQCLALIASLAFAIFSTTPLFGITWHYEANFYFFPPGYFPNGLTMSGNYSFENLPPNSTCNTINASCYAVTSHDAIIGGQHFIGGIPDNTGYTSMEIVAANDIPGDTYYRDRYASLATTNDVFQTYPNLQVAYFGLLFEKDGIAPNRPTALLSTALPLSTNDVMTGFEGGGREAIVQFRDPSGAVLFVLYGVATLTEVPEPSSAVLLCLGCAGLGLIAQRGLNSEASARRLRVVALVRSQPRSGGRT